MVLPHLYMSTSSSCTCAGATCSHCDQILQKHAISRIELAVDVEHAVSIRFLCCLATHRILFRIANNMADRRTQLLGIERLCPLLALPLHKHTTRQAAFQFNNMWKHFIANAAELLQVVP